LLLAAAGVTVALAMVLTWATGAAAQVGPVRHCLDSGAFLEGHMGMATVVESDSISDWRSHRRVAGCRITAAGVTTRTAGAQAAYTFDVLREAGWTRTPNPRDAPNEASLRFRRGGSDCVFSFYTGGLLGTEAEGAVDEARVPGPGERRYNFVVLCMEASP
jgi:hypothetical protein